ncbi:MAG TPA: amidohydrolase [Anaerolineae bacterium]|nr:amidohydrolase [Anaerolineae bacterium]
MTNGRLYTQDVAYEGATAVAVANGRIVAVGSDDEILALGGEVVDLNGRCLIPGLVDAHVHFQWFSLNLQNLDLSETTSLAEALSLIKEKAVGMRPGQWLQGRGWAQDNWTDRAFPTAAALDQIVPHLPVCLRDKSGHAAWVNSTAMRLAELTPSTPDPEGGKIQRDERGRPTGILFEEAIGLVMQHVPETTETELVAAMERGQAYCWERGLTGIHDFDGRASFQALQTLHQRKDLGLRVVKNIPKYRYEHAVGVGLRTGFGDEWLRIGGVKMFADGALGPRTAAMIAPYEGEPENRGVVVTDKEEMYSVASAASAAGLSVTVHAIGDRAVYDVLDVYAAVRGEEAERGQSPAQLRHRIEHVQVYHPADLERLAKYQIIASMQPIHATADIDMVDRYWGERGQYSYAFRNILESGALVVFGSDAPIESIDPLLGLHAAVTRRRANGYPGVEGWYPEQKLTMAEAVYGFTMAAAITSGQQDDLGSVTPGKLADFTIFERDIFETPADELLEVAVAGTVVGGEFKHRSF